jgi:hypothetical protein
MYPLVRRKAGYPTLAADPHQEFSITRCSIEEVFPNHRVEAGSSRSLIRLRQSCRVTFTLTWLKLVRFLRETTLPIDARFYHRLLMILHFRNDYASRRAGRGKTVVSYHILFTDRVATAPTGQPTYMRSAGIKSPRRSAS